MDAQVNREVPSPAEGHGMKCVGCGSTEVFEGGRWIPDIVCETKGCYARAWEPNVDEEDYRPSRMDFYEQEQARLDREKEAVAEGRRFGKTGFATEMVKHGLEKEHDPRLGPNQNVLRTLDTDKEARKGSPIFTGVIDYFPLAITEIARLSKAGNDQHNPGQPLHWARGKSSDHADCIGRHMIERGTFDSDGIRHSAKVAWRALAQLQEELEAAAGFDPTGEGS